MNPESQWIFVLVLTGALFATMAHNIALWAWGDNALTTIAICVAFFIAIIMSPTYYEVSQYWKEKHGR